MSRELLLKLDHFRDLWGAPVSISRDERGIGRRDGDGNTSQHNMDAWGEVRAVDIHPSGMNTAQDRQRAYKAALDAGLTGIGIYTNWNTHGMHLDVRKTATVATWSGYNDSQGVQHTDAGIERIFT